MAVKYIKGSEVGTTLTNDLSIVNVSATWCGPCKMMAPILEEVSNKVPVFKVDLDENKDFATEIGVQGVPSTFIYKDGKVVDKIVGFVPITEIESRLKKVA